MTLAAIVMLVADRIWTTVDTPWPWGALTVAGGIAAIAIFAVEIRSARISGARFNLAYPMISLVYVLLLSNRLMEELGATASVKGAFFSIWVILSLILMITSTAASCERKEMPR
jgi:hypothetical protein